ncbi:hypothetical protein D9M68_757700 [compost metagenome]
MAALKDLSTHCTHGSTEFAAFPFKQRRKQNRLQSMLSCGFRSCEAGSIPGYQDDILADEMLKLVLSHCFLALITAAEMINDAFGQAIP